MKVAITGGIGSGKSYVCDLLAQRGIDIYNCDNEAKRLMASSNSIHNKLVCAVGSHKSRGLGEVIIEFKDEA